MSYITKNYEDQGGNRLVIGGEIHYEDAAIITVGKNALAAKMMHYQVAAAKATAAVADGIHVAKACPAVNVAAAAVVKAASAITDILTITETVALGATGNSLNVLLTTAAGDTLAVTKTDGTKTINIALANTTAAKNTASLIQSAIQALTTVGGIAVGGVTCVAGGNWDTAAIATGQAGSVAFSGGLSPSDVIITGITNPSVPRSITATAGGTSGDIKAVAVIIAGTNFEDVAITETLPVFTLDTPGTVEGLKAFKTVTSITVPAADGLGATVSIGFGEKLGLPSRLAHNTVTRTFLNNTKEGTDPTVTVDAVNLSGNTIKLNSTLNGTVVDAYYIK